ncbi:hypothetical protein VTO42DRAFT_2408 [Malbranchea cinnamomea]
MDGTPIAAEHYAAPARPSKVDVDGHDDDPFSPKGSTRVESPGRILISRRGVRTSPVLGAQGIRQGHPSGRASRAEETRPRPHEPDAMRDCLTSSTATRSGGRAWRQNSPHDLHVY